MRTKYHPSPLENLTEHCTKSGSCAPSAAEWKTFHGRVVGFNFYTLPNLCDISPDGTSPCCHLGDGCSDLVIIKPCSRAGMLSHIQRNFNSKDQVLHLLRMKGHDNRDLTLAIFAAISWRFRKLLAIPQRFESPVVYTGDLKSRLKSQPKSPL